MPAHGSYPNAQIAVAQAMYPEQRPHLPDVAHPGALSTELQHLTLDDASDAADREPYSGDVADRNQTSQGTSQRARPLSGATDASYDLNPVEATPPEFASSAGSLKQPHNPDIANSHRSVDASVNGDPVAPLRSPPRSTDPPRASLDKLLPHTPPVEFETGPEDGHVLRQEPDRSHGGINGLADKSIDLAGIVDLRKTEDTTLHTTQAPAVIHETITQNIHTIYHQEITREIHEYHVFHRILPITDIEVLPPRHFVPLEEPGTFAEIAASEIPGRTGENQDWAIVETVTRVFDPEARKPAVGAGAQAPILPTRFTARKFADDEGEYKEYTTPEGVKRTEQWWVHPPTFYEPLAKASGQTYPFYVGSPNPAENGLRIEVGGGKVVGISPGLARERREAAKLAGSADGEKI